MISQVSAVFIVPAIIFGAFGSIYLKKGAKDFTFNLKKWKQNITAGIGLFLFGISMLSYLLALRHGELSVLYSLSSFVYVMMAFLSQKMLNEKMNKMKWIGIFLIILGSSIVVW
jgi:uncharacterized membrane protein